MRYVLIAIALAALCVTAFAQGENPTAKVFIHFGNAANWEDDKPGDNAGVVGRYDPTQYETFYAYIGVTDLGLGFTTISFKLADPSVSFPGVFAPPSFTNLMPGDLAIGAWNTGITIAATECMNEDTDGARAYIDPVLIGKLSLFYLSGTSEQADIMIEDHPDYPRWIVDCNDPGLVDYFCVWHHGGVWKDPIMGDTGCVAETPVEVESWTQIKALYR